MQKSLWANFCPKKYHWELKQLSEFNNLPEYWWQTIPTIKKELTLLKKAGIVGLRLNIFSNELCENAEDINWEPLDLFLELANQLNLEIHLCLGPYQYPLTPGIRFPHTLLDEKKVHKIIDNNKKWKEFGMTFLEEQLKRYGRSKLISGFYLGNEWHTNQKIEDFHQKASTFLISEKHQKSLARICKKLTRKPIFFNTNWDAYQLKKIQHTFLPLFNILKNQAWVGFDIYPSQITYTKSPQLAFHQKFHSYKSDVEQVKKKFTQRVLVSEFEAQPWSTNRSWYQQITEKPQLPQIESQKLKMSFGKFIQPKLFEYVTLLGAEFWLIAYHIGHTDMLDTIAEL